MNYHFIGLGGIGMSALARILHKKGHRVQGSDRTTSPLLEQLAKEGIAVQVGHDANAVHPNTTVIYSTDVKETNVEVMRAKELNLPMLHRSDLLDQLMQGKKSLLVTGTHGKTTTTSLLASVLVEGKLDPSFVVGGILRSLNTNAIVGDGSYFAAEADESDGSFLKTSPFGAIVTNLENDHLEYWGSQEKLDEAFRNFFANVKNPEHLFWCKDDSRLCGLQPPGVSYGFSENADLRITSVKQRGNGLLFDLVYQGKNYLEVELALLGRHNALNAAAVFGLCLSLNIAERVIRSALQKFSGTERRLEWKGEEQKITLYDDYGHHPTEIAATIRALSDSIYERRLVVVFQPHRYSRVRELMQDFTTCFEDADLVLLTDIYSAGEAPIEGITSAALYTRMREKLGAKLHFFPRQYLEKGVVQLARPLDVILTMGAGDVTKAVQPILKEIKQKGPKLKIGILCGGTSAEHPVSLMSARNVISALDPSVYEMKIFGLTREGDWLFGANALALLEQKNYLRSENGKISDLVLRELSQCDLCIPVFHGLQGEDGMIQGFLDTLQIPYAGCDYRASALCMQKTWTKQIAQMNNVPTAPYFQITQAEYRRNASLINQKIEKELHYPVWIKPVHLGSSIGVSRVDDAHGVSKAVDLAFYYDDTVIVERHVEGRQVEFSLIGNETLRMALPAEVLSDGAFHDYESKYGPNAAKFSIPPDISDLDQKIGMELAEKMYRSAGCKGLARIDFFYDFQGHFWFNEINPFPGITDTSAFPQSWKKTNISLSMLCDELIAAGLQRSRRLMEIRGH